MNKNEKAVKVLAIIGVICGLFGIFLAISESSLAFFIAGALLLVWGALDLSFISSKNKSLIPVIKFFAVLGIIIGIGNFSFLAIQNELNAITVISSLFWLAWGVYDFRMLSPRNLFDKKLF